MLQDCPFCHHGRATPVHEKAGDRAGRVRDVVRCSECSAYYSRPRFDEAEFSALCAAGSTGTRPTYADPTIALPEETVLWKLKRFLTPIAYPFDVRAFLARHHVPRGAALDLGSANGRFVYVLKAMGFAASGVEPDPAMVQWARSKGLDVHEGTFPQALPPSLAERRYTLISALESICYFCDLAQALKVVRELLVEGGYFLVKCHQAHSQYYGSTGAGPFARYGDTVQAMPVLSSLTYWLERSGFEVVAATGGPWASAVGDGSLKDWWRQAADKLRSIDAPGLRLVDLETADSLVVLSRKHSQRAGDGTQRQ